MNKIINSEFNMLSITILINVNNITNGRTDAVKKPIR